MKTDRETRERKDGGIWMKAGRGKEMGKWVGEKVDKLARRRKRHYKATRRELNDLKFSDLFQ